MLPTIGLPRLDVGSSWRGKYLHLRRLVPSVMDRQNRRNEIGEGTITLANLQCYLIPYRPSFLLSVNVSVPLIRAFRSEEESMKAFQLRRVTVQNKSDNPNR